MLVESFILIGLRLGRDLGFKFSLKAIRGKGIGNRESLVSAAIKDELESVFSLYSW